MRSHHSIAAALSFASLLLATPLPSQGAQFRFLRQPLPDDAVSCRALATGDVDGDGDIDVLVGSYAAPYRLLINDGLGRFREEGEARLPSVPAASGAAALLDVDGDGDLDAFVGSASGDQLLVNDGTGNFADASAMLLPSGPIVSSRTAIGDLDGDGDVDLVLSTTRASGGHTTLLINSGSGSFTDATDGRIPVDADTTTGLALADVDADGDLDILVAKAASSSAGQNLLFLNDGHGVFHDATVTNLPLVSDQSTAVVFGDVDGDGDPDVLVGARTTSAIPFQTRLWINDGHGVFTDATTADLPFRLGNATDAAFGDLDGDGDLDVLAGYVAGDHSSRNDVWLNDGGGHFAVAPTLSASPIQDDTYAIALADVDGDGDLDALVGNDEQDRLLLSDGHAHLTESTAPTLPPSEGSLHAAAFGDLDGDGDLDLVTSASSSDATGTGHAVLLNDGVGRFVAAPAGTLPPRDLASASLALGDVDGDGDLDVYFANGLRGSSRDQLYLNDGAGRFADVATTHLPPVYAVSHIVRLGDIDGDGDLDAFVGNITGSVGTGRDLLFLNDGSGVFADASSQLPARTEWTESADLGDVDGDGDLDLFLGNSPAYLQRSYRLYLNDGTGTFVDATGRLPDTPHLTVRAIALADVDGDGDLDAIAGTEAQNRLFLNDGAGFFTDVTDTNLPAFEDGTRSLVAGDFDGDGDVDFVTGNSGYGTPPAHAYLYDNHGDGVFTLSVDGMPQTSGSAFVVAAGDVDRDGDVDIFLGYQGVGSRIATNIRAQLAWRAPPRLGKPLRYDVFGPGSGPFGVCFGLTETSTATPFGELRLDVTTAFSGIVGTLDTGGHAVVELPIPDDPAALGATVYAQAIVAEPLRLTNLESATLTGL